MNRTIPSFLSMIALAFVLHVGFLTPTASAQGFFTDVKRAVANIFSPKVVGSGIMAKETREFGNFHTVVVDAPFGVDIESQANTSNVYLEGDDNILPLISTTLKNGVLTISVSNEVNTQGFENKRLTVIVHAPNAERVELYGAGSVDVTNINSPNYALKMHGVGSLDAQGTVGNLSIDANGIGTVNAKSLKAQNAKVESHGIGSTSVYASTNLDITLSGIGSLVYYGNPAHFTKNVGGIGSVSKGSSGVQP